ncbi:hypothetical protein IMZ48_02110 [Candidatus Bathyarchaeota archaeon]|nr:hypothetical protein [Candidatus Bathyarchaeota archaeon]
MPSLYTLALTAALATAVAAQDPTCDVVGYDSGTIFAILVQDDPALADRIPCADTCVATADCAAFAFGDGQCLLYGDSIAGNVYEVETSPFTFNDVACVAGEVETPSPTESGGEPVEGTAAPEEPPAEETPAPEETAAPEETPVEGQPGQGQ